MRGSAAQNLERAEVLLEGYLSAAPREELLEQQPVKLGFLEAECRYAGVTAEYRKGILIRMGVYGVLSLIIGVFLGSKIPLLVGGGLSYVEYLTLKRKAAARAHSFEKDYTAMLLSLASAIRTGLDPLAAILQLGKLFSPSSEVYKELATLKANVESGMQEEEAVRRFGSSIAHPDLRLFITAFILARREGSSLSECLQRLARVTRQRQSFRRKIRSAVAMQKLSAIGIGASAVVIGIIQVSSNPEGLKLALAHPIGSKILGFGIFLIGAGIAWMMRLASTRV
jgi:Flp pilus assembly protein TadB